MNYFITTKITFAKFYETVAGYDTSAKIVNVYIKIVGLWF